LLFEEVMRTNTNDIWSFQYLFESIELKVYY